jgi:hypothetical protein
LRDLSVQPASLRGLDLKGTPGTSKIPPVPSQSARRPGLQSLGKDRFSFNGESAIDAKERPSPGARISIRPTTPIFAQVEVDTQQINLTARQTCACRRSGPSSWRTRGLFAVAPAPSGVNTIGKPRPLLQGAGSALRQPRATSSRFWAAGASAARSSGLQLRDWPQQADRGPSAPKAGNNFTVVRVSRILPRPVRHRRSWSSTRSATGGQGRPGPIWNGELGARTAGVGIGRVAHSFGGFAGAHRDTRPTGTPVRVEQQPRATATGKTQLDFRIRHRRRGLQPGSRVIWKKHARLQADVHAGSEPMSAGKDSQLGVPRVQPAFQLTTATSTSTAASRTASPAQSPITMDWENRQLHSAPRSTGAREGLKNPIPGAPRASSVPAGPPRAASIDSPARNTDPTEMDPTDGTNGTSGANPERHPGHKPIFPGDDSGTGAVSPWIRTRTLQQNRPAAG